MPVGLEYLRGWGLPVHELLIRIHVIALELNLLLLLLEHELLQLEVLGAVLRHRRGGCDVGHMHGLAIEPVRPHNSKARLDVLLLLQVLLIDGHLVLLHLVGVWEVLLLLLEELGLRSQLGRQLRVHHQVLLLALVRRDPSQQLRMSIHQVLFLQFIGLVVEVIFIFECMVEVDLFIGACEEVGGVQFLAMGEGPGALLGPEDGIAGHWLSSAEHV